MSGYATLSAAEDDDGDQSPASQASTLANSITAKGAAEERLERVNAAELELKAVLIKLRDDDGCSGTELSEAIEQAIEMMREDSRASSPAASPAVAGEGEGEAPPAQADGASADADDDSAAAAAAEGGAMHKPKPAQCRPKKMKKAGSPVTSPNAGSTGEFQKQATVPEDETVETGAGVLSSDQLQEQQTAPPRKGPRPQRRASMIYEEQLLVQMAVDEEDEDEVGEDADGTRMNALGEEIEDELASEAELASVLKQQSAVARQRMAKYWRKMSNEQKRVYIMILVNEELAKRGKEKITSDAPIKETKAKSQGLLSTLASAPSDKAKQMIGIGGAASLPAEATGGLMSVKEYSDLLEEIWQFEMMKRELHMVSGDFEGQRVHLESCARKHTRTKELLAELGDGKKAERSRTEFLMAAVAVADSHRGLGNPGVELPLPSAGGVKLMVQSTKVRSDGMMGSSPSANFASGIGAARNKHSVKLGSLKR